ncbi:MAG: hypothetical protein RLY43_2397 [Bacteroidota bacterium]|jgi:hypothetical protein
MKNILADFVKYFLKKYPYKQELSASRLTKMMYLADWKSAIDDSSLLTNVKWHFNHYGPYVDDFIESVSDDPDVLLESVNNFYGSKKTLISMKNYEWQDHLTTRQKEIFDFVIEATKDKTYSDFIKLVYSTYPVVTGSRYVDLDLLKFARDYRELKKIPMGKLNQ